jgi:hypothetical protein
MIGSNESGSFRTPIVLLHRPITKAPLYAAGCGAALSLDPLVEPRTLAPAGMPLAPIGRLRLPKRCVTLVGEPAR